MLDLGTVKPGTTVFIPFHTFDSNDPSASVTITGLATTDIEVFKDGGTTTRASDAGYALLGTDGIDEYGTGIHGISVDLADNTAANFYEAGSQYWVIIASITVDGATVNFVAATFRIGYPGALLDTTIATLATQVSFTLEEGSADADAYNGCIAYIHDLASSVQVAIGLVSDYAITTRTVTLAADPGIFTMAAGDNISLFPPALLPTVAGRTVDITATGAAGIDWANVENPTTALDLSGTDIQLVDTCTTNTDMVGTDSALLAASAPTNFGDMSITVTTGLVDITQTAADKVWSTAARTLTAFSTSLALSVWDVLESAIVTASTIGLKVKNNLDAAITSRLAPTTAARTLDVNAAGEAGLDLDNTSGTIAAAQIATDAITAAKLAADVATEIRDAILPLTNTALSNIKFLWVAASDHVTPVTGASTTSVTRSIDGGAFGAGTGTLAEVGNGIYQYDASQADMNGGIITFRFVATGGTPGAPDDAFLTIVTSAGV